MAQGSPTPRWPMPDVCPKFATWSLGGGRPAGCSLANCQRWHAGIDLTGAPDKALVVAPEDGTLVGLDKGWTEGARAIFLRTDTGLFLVLGGMTAGSHKEFARTQGQRVRAGDPLARIAGHYEMLHFETYRDEPTRTANSRWWKGETPPVGLLKPTNYVERMVGDDVSLVQTRQRLAALASLGHYKGDLDAFVMLWGCVQITRKGTEQPARFCLHATRAAPLFIINPGSYCVLAESNVLGVRRRGPTL